MDKKIFEIQFDNVNGIAKIVLAKWRHAEGGIIVLASGNYPDLEKFLAQLVREANQMKNKLDQHFLGASQPNPW